MGQEISDAQLEEYIVQDNFINIDTSYDNVPDIHIVDNHEGTDEIAIPDPKVMLANLKQLEIYFDATFHPESVLQIREMQAILNRHLNFC